MWKAYFDQSLGPAALKTLVKISDKHCTLNKLFVKTALKTGRDEKGGLLSTEKKAAVDVNHRPSCTFLLVDVDHPAIFYWSTSTILPFSTGQRLLGNLTFSTCLFLVVDIDHPEFFNLVDVDLPFSTCLFLVVDVDLPFSNWSTCLFQTGWRPGRPSTLSTSILQPFSSGPTNFTST